MPNATKSNMSRPPDTKFRFMDLPTELQILILEFALVDSKPIKAPTKCGGKYPWTLVNLMCINKSMNELASQVYYGENKFVVGPRCEGYWTNQRYIALGKPFHKPNCGLMFPPTAFGHLVRYLKLNLEIYAQCDNLKHYLRGGCG